MRRARSLSLDGSQMACEAIVGGVSRVDAKNGLVMTQVHYLLAELDEFRALLNLGESSQ